MDNCFFCGKETYSTFFKKNRYLSSLYDNVTGESFDICTDCFKRLGFGETAKVFMNIKRLGLRPASRQLQLLNLLPEEFKDNINNQTVAILSKKHLPNCTGYLVYNLDQYLLFDQTNRKILLNATSVCSFDDIMDYKVLDHSVEYNVHSPERTDYTTHSKNAIGRAFLGKVVAGNAGAMIGGLTADHSLSIEKSGYSTYSKTTHDFSIVIRLRLLGNNSAILSIGESEEELTTLCNALDTVISLK